MLTKKVAKHGSLVDVCCGPCYLFGKVQKIRPDLRLQGIDIDERYIEHARSLYPTTNFIVRDVREWNPDQTYNIVLCTAGIHHLPYPDQPAFIRKLAQATGEVCITADPLVGPYRDEGGRIVAAAELGYEYLRATVKAGAPQSVIQAAIEVLENDVRGHEYKTSRARLERSLRKNFGYLIVSQIWGKRGGYGDYVFELRNPIR